MMLFPFSATQVIITQGERLAGGKNAAKIDDYGNLHATGDVIVEGVPWDLDKAYGSSDDYFVSN
jgi:hypothetical protein